MKGILSTVDDVSTDSGVRGGWATLMSQDMGVFCESGIL